AGHGAAHARRHRGAGLQRHPRRRAALGSAGRGRQSRRRSRRAAARSQDSMTVAKSPGRQGRMVWTRLLQHRAVAIGLVLIGIIVLAALLAPFIAPHDPLAMPDPVGLRAGAPSRDHLLGTDAFSRDVLSRLLFGARVSLVVGLVSATLAVLIGGAVGLAAGLGGPKLDATLMRGGDVALALPRV